MDRTASGGRPSALICQLWAEMERALESKTFVHTISPAQREMLARALIGKGMRPHHVGSFLRGQGIVSHRDIDTKGGTGAASNRSAGPVGWY